MGLYQLFMLALCVLALLMLVAGTFFNPSPAIAEILWYIDTGICAIFLLDFAVCLMRAPSKLRYLRWGWIDLVSSIPFVHYLRWGRVARVARILRLLRGVRSGRRLAVVIIAHRAQSAFTAAVFLAILVILFASVGILEYENAPGSNIKTAEDALWWSCVTITTVGYGDKYPVTTGGRVIAVALMATGIGLFGTFTGLVASWFLVAGEEKQDAKLAGIKEELAKLRAAMEDLQK